MSPAPHQPLPGVPVIPPPPPRAPNRRRGELDRRWLIWPGAFALGIVAGVVVYRFTALDWLFDYCVALAAK